MGCLPLSNCSFKICDTKDNDSKRYSLLSRDSNKSGKDDRKNKIHKIKIIGSILVQKCAGDPLEHYEILNKLGEGTFGEVFKVLHKSYKCIRAMKVINKIKTCMGEEEEKDIINEINILKDLDHPNILKVFEYFNTKLKFFIITELCTGGELFDRITEVKFFNEKVAAHIMRQLEI
jgi:calcium-dependent protein kinase